MRLTRDGGCQLTGGTVGHVDNGGGSFVNHHLMFVSQAALDEVKQWAVVPVKATYKTINTLYIYLFSM